MRFSSVLASVALLGGATAGTVHRSTSGYEVPDNNGFPNPDQKGLDYISEEAGGKLPGGPLPDNLGPDAITAFQLIAFNELFETAYFSSLLYNVTEGVHGYGTDDKKAVITVIKAVLAQEELHALAAIASLKASNAFAPTPCKYKFPVDNLVDAVALAETFTAVVLGALQDANVIFAKDSQFDAVRIISSVIGQEGEQNGAYRLFLKRIPSEPPFLTFVPGPFAFSALQAFVVPGSCPYDLAKIALPIFPPLLVNDQAIAVVEPKDQTLEFTADLSGFPKAKEYLGKTEGLYLTYTTGQQLPITVDIHDVKWTDDTISFTAKFPFYEYAMGGFSHAALTTSNNIPTAADVPNFALAAPGVIQVNQPLYGGH